MPFTIFLVTFLFQFILTHFRKILNSASTPPGLCTHSLLSYPLNSSISKYPNKALHPSSLNHGVTSWCSFTFLWLISFSTILSQIFSNHFAKKMYKVSTKYLLKRTFVRYVVVQVHWFWALSSRVLNWYRISNRTAVTAKDCSTSAQLHIITDGTRYTEHNMHVHRYRT